MNTTASPKPRRTVYLLGLLCWLGACAQAATNTPTTSDDDDSSSSSTAAAGGMGGTGTGGDSAGGAGAAGGSSNLPCGIDCSTIDTSDCTKATCNQDSKKCEIVPEEAGTSCDDSQFCTTNDTCDGTGQCVGGPQNDCGMTPPDCQNLVCNEVSKSCQLVPAVNGTACTAADLCKVNAVCENGLCTGGATKDCFFAPVPNECHVSACNPQSGLCEPVPGNDGQGCSDQSDLCITNKICQAGACVGGQAKDCTQLTQGCFDGVCDPQSGQCVSVPVPPGGNCAEASDQCNQGICDSQGNCVGQPANEGQSCNDNSFCTSGDFCSGGSCVGMSTITQCTPGDFCCPPGCTIQTDSDCQPNITVKDAVDRGWWRDNGAHTSNNNNTLTGQTSISSKYNSYFIFDLTGLSGTVITAKLKMEIENYSSPDQTENMSVWDVSTPANTLEATGNDVAIYNDLMTGNTYGSFVVDKTDKGKILTITLNAQAITDINAALGGKFSVGMHVDSLGGNGSEWVRFSASSEQRTHQLELGIL